jgi:hypothetical protein
MIEQSLKFEFDVLVLQSIIQACAPLLSFPRLTNGSRLFRAAGSHDFETARFHKISHRR